MIEYSQELAVNFVRIEGEYVVLNIRGSEKKFHVENEATMKEIESHGFVEGEKLKLLYTDKTRWEIKRYVLSAPGIEKYLRKDE